MVYLHPGRLRWNLQIIHLERKMIFQTFIIMFHVNLPGLWAGKAPDWPGGFDFEQNVKRHIVFLRVKGTSEKRTRLVGSKVTLFTHSFYIYLHLADLFDGICFVKLPVITVFHGWFSFFLRKKTIPKEPYRNSPWFFPAGSTVIEK